MDRWPEDQANDDRNANHGASNYPKFQLLVLAPYEAQYNGSKTQDRNCIEDQDRTNPVVVSLQVAASQPRIMR
ncbi:MAG: hypothetical protein ACKVHR_15850 [Pirellulales bacterium]